MLSSMFLIFWKRVCLGMRKLVQWRKKCIVDSISLLHSHKGFKVSWKQCLNLCSWRWLGPKHNLVNILKSLKSYVYFFKYDILILLNIKIICTAWNVSASEFLWSVLFRNRTEYGEIRSISPVYLSPNARKDGPENFRIRTLLLIGICCSRGIHMLKVHSK